MNTGPDRVHWSSSNVMGWTESQGNKTPSRENGLAYPSSRTTSLEKVECHVREMPPDGHIPCGQQGPTITWQKPQPWAPKSAK